MFLKHSTLFYNLDQNVFTVDVKTYFYKILKMISIYVLEMIFYDNSWQYSYNCPHSSGWASGVYKSYFPWNMPHSQVEAYRYVHSDLIRFFILIIDNILWGPTWSYYMYMYLSLHDEAGQLRVLNTERVLFNCQDAWSIIYIFDPHLCKELSVTGTMYAHASSYHLIRVCIVNVLYTCMHTY